VRETPFTFSDTETTTIARKNITCKAASGLKLITHPNLLQRLKVSEVIPPHAYRKPYPAKPLPRDAVKLSRLFRQNVVVEGLSLLRNREFLGSNTDTNTGCPVVILYFFQSLH
jgi:hypothetical protein